MASSIAPPKGYRPEAPKKVDKKTRWEPEFTTVSQQTPSLQPADDKFSPYADTSGNEGLFHVTTQF
jgi:hypothetical protein